MSKLPIFYNALLLTAVNLLLRLVGTGFQVFLSSRIGAEGIGLLQLVMSVGAMALVAGMAGVRTATMYLTAEEIGKNRGKNLTRVISCCILYSLCFSFAVAALLYTLAPWLAANWIGNCDTVNGLRLFAFYLPVNCLCGVLVGYFTGANRITTLAMVEIAEQLCTIGATILLLIFWAGHNPERSCMSVILGNAIGCCLTLSTLTCLRIREHGPDAGRFPTRSRLCAIALPLALADDLRTGISTLENIMVPKRLALYPGTANPLAAFGMVCGMVFPILMFPASILFGLTELLIPEIARCRAAGSHARISHLIQKSLKIALLYGTVCSGVLYLAAEPLCQALYKNPEAGIYLRRFAPIAVLLYCDCVTDAIIKGLGQQKISVRYNILTSSMDVVFLFLLLPRYGIIGYLISFVVTHVLNFILSLRRLLLISGERISARVPAFCILAALLSVRLCLFLSKPAASLCAFFLLLFSLWTLLRVVGKDDIRWLWGLLRPGKRVLTS